MQVIAIQSDHEGNMSAGEYQVAMAYAAYCVEKHPFFIKGRDEGVSMKDIRYFLEKYLAGYETKTLCMACPVKSQRPEKGPNTGCCSNCPLLDLNKGCTDKSSACLGFTCHHLRNYLQDRGGNFEFRQWAWIFRDLDSYFHTNRVPEHYMFRIIPFEHTRATHVQHHMPYWVEQMGEKDPALRVTWLRLRQ